MRHVRLNIRLVALVAVAVAAVLIGSSLAPPREARAAFPSPQGVLCGYLHDLVVGGNPLPFSGTTLTRIDFDDPNVTLTAVAYTDPTGTLAMPNCKNPQEAMPAGASVPDVTSEVRPSLTGLTYANNKIEGSGCQEDFVFGGFPFSQWTRITLQLDMSKTPAQSTGSFEFENPYASKADCEIGGLPTTISVQFNAVFMDGPDPDKAAYDSDWDKDGCLDWDELDPDPKAPLLDPFNPGDCGVGGIAELPAVAGTSLEAGSSGSDAGLIAAAAAATAAGALAVGSAARYARRRSVR